MAYLTRQPSAESFGEQTASLDFTQESTFAVKYKDEFGSDRIAEIHAKGPSHAVIIAMEAIPSVSANPNSIISIIPWD